MRFCLPVLRNLEKEHGLIYLFIFEQTSTSSDSVLKKDRKVTKFRNWM
jgi:hypothetical protein